MSEKYSFIDADKAHYPIVKMCAWRDRPAPATARHWARPAVPVQAIFDASDGTYGYRRIHAALARQCEDCGPELVRDLMRELGLVPCRPRPWRPTTTQPARAARPSPTRGAATSPPTRRAPSSSGISPITVGSGRGYVHLARSELVSRICGLIRYA